MENVEENLIHGIKESTARNFVGKKADYYIHKWQKVKNMEKGWLWSWNWWAFIGGFLWLGYRKMYGMALLSAGMFFAFDIAAGLTGHPGNTGAGSAISGILGTMGNIFYFKHMKKAVTKAVTQYSGDPDAQEAAVARAGGTSWLGVVVVLTIGVVFGVASDLFFGYLTGNCIDRGKEYMRTGKPDNAIVEFSEALKYNKETEAALVLRGGVYADTGEINKAISDFSSAIKLDSKNDSYLQYRAAAYDKKGDTDKAIADYTRAVELNPKNFQAFFKRGNIYGNGGKNDLALADYESTIAVNSKFALAYYNKGVVCERLGKSKEAAEAYRQMIALNPQDESEKQLLETAKRRLAVLDARVK